MFGKQKLLVCMQKVSPPQKKSDNFWSTVKKPDLDEKISKRPRKNELNWLINIKKSNKMGSVLIYMFLGPPPPLRLVQ